MIKKKPAGAGFLEVLFLGLPPSAGCQAASANNSSLAVICFSLITSVDSRAVCSSTLCPVETVSGPSKVYFGVLSLTGRGLGYQTLSFYGFKYTFGGPGRYCPAVQNTFQITSYSNNFPATVRACGSAGKH